MGILRTLEKQKTICIIAFSIYILVVLKLTIFRQNVYYEERQLNLALFTGLINTYRYTGIGEFIRLFFGNIFWFIPLGIFLPMFLRKRNFLIIIVIGFMFSLTIETIQYIFHKGVAELDDLILNTFGVAMGYYVFKWLY